VPGGDRVSGVRPGAGRHPGCAPERKGSGRAGEYQIRGPFASGAFPLTMRELFARLEIGPGRASPQGKYLPGYIQMGSAYISITLVVCDHHAHLGSYEYCAPAHQG